MVKIEYKAFPDQQVEGDWRVEALDPQNAEVYIAIFSGNNAEMRAVEYAMMKNGTHPIFEQLKKAKALVVAAPAAVPAPMPAPVIANVCADEFEIATRNGHLLRVRPKDLSWMYDDKRKKLSAEPKPAIERIGGIAEKETRG